MCVSFSQAVLERVGQYTSWQIHSMLYHQGLVCNNSSFFGKSFEKHVLLMKLLSFTKKLTKFQIQIFWEKKTPLPPTLDIKLVNLVSLQHIF
jgi:hypothetical protein